jgi:hypothetical protein
VRVRLENPQTVEYSRILLCATKWIAGTLRLLKKHDFARQKNRRQSWRRQRSSVQPSHSRHLRSERVRCPSHRLPSKFRPQLQLPHPSWLRNRHRRWRQQQRIKPQEETQTQARNPDGFMAQLTAKLPTRESSGPVLSMVGSWCGNATQMSMTTFSLSGKSTRS